MSNRDLQIQHRGEIIELWCYVILLLVAFIIIIDQAVLKTRMDALEVRIEALEQEIK